MIRAEVHADDFAATAKFDATPFFEGADDEMILGLAECGWGGDYEADAVARDVEDRPGYADVQAVLSHCRDTGGVGFECRVHAADAYDWVRANRPALLDGLRGRMGLDTGEEPGRAEPHWDSDASWDGDYASQAAAAPGA